MTSLRHVLIDWAEQGRIAPGALENAFAVAGIFPTREGWLRFVDRLQLWLGALLIAAGVIFFFAYNWNELGRLGKFGLVEIAIVAALAVTWRTGLDSVAGKATLLAASLFVGALLALVGQTYQTGADTYELFSAWAVLILPWAVAGRLAALWLVWIALLNLAIVFYYTVFGFFGMLFAPERLMWLLFALNTIAMGAWELVARGRGEDRWAIRILATASGAIATTLAIFAIVDFRHSDSWGALAWILYIAGAYIVYRRVYVDLYVLAGGVLSVVIVVATGLAETMFKSGDAAGAFLLIGMIVIGLSAAGGWWLKRIAGGEGA